MCSPITCTWCLKFSSQLLIDASPPATPYTTTFPVTRLATSTLLRNVSPPTDSSTTSTPRPRRHRYLRRQVRGPIVDHVIRPKPPYDRHASLAEAVAITVAP